MELSTEKPLREGFCPVRRNFMLGGSACVGAKWRGRGRERGRVKREEGDREWEGHLLCLLDFGSVYMQLL